MSVHSAPRKSPLSFLATRNGRIAAAVLALVIAGVATGIAVGSGGGGNKPKVTLPAVATTNCPLTDTPAPNNVVPDRPALAVKIGNEPGAARPQSGLNEADVVFDTPAEGFIMRYIGVFQCQTASAIGPTRSLRWVDSRLVNMLGNPILAFAGGINPDVDYVMGLTWLTPANLLEGAQAAAQRTTNRVAPDNLYTSTTALYSFFSKAKGAPKPIFTFSTKALTEGTKVRGLHIDFSGGTNVIWKWDAAKNYWIHTYSGVTDRDAITNDPVTTTNIAAISVKYTFGPYPENPGGSGDFESQVIGSGPGYVLRNGRAVKVTWTRPTAADPMVFTDSSGKVVAMSPGRTWVEIVPDTIFNTPASFGLLTATS